MLRKRLRSWRGPWLCLAVLGVGVAGVVGGWRGRVADGGGSGEPRDGVSAGLAADEVKGVLDLLFSTRWRDEDGGGWSACSLVGLALVGEPGEGDLRLAKEVERKRERRRVGV